MKNNEDIFFFGAGFSKSLINAYPTLTELSKYFLDKGLINEDEKIYSNNLEQLLTYLIAPLPFKTEQQILIDKASYLEKISAISRYFMDIRKSDPIDKDNEYILTLAKYINDNECTCITLNYDLLLEEMLSKEEDYSSYYKIPMLNALSRIEKDANTNDSANVFVGGNSVVIRRTKNYYPVNIIKLHGSINWFYAKDFNNIYYTESDCNKMALQGLKSLIIPPVLDKTKQYGYNIIQVLWGKAAKEIQNAKNIYIYGFSFPMTDLSVSYLFKSALSQNKNDYTIYVINTDNNLRYKQKRYKEIFGEDKCNFDFCCKNNLETLAKHLNEKSQK